MQKHHFTPLFVLLLFSILLTACQPGSAPTAAEPTHHWRPTSTRRPTRTITPTYPTATATPTPTPTPPLADEGPYFAYITQEDEKPSSLIFVNADGSGFRQIPLPQENCAYGITNSLSPDGRWYAFYTGTMRSILPDCYETSNGNDLQLNLLNIETGEIIPVTRLLGPDTPQNFMRVGQRLFLTPPYIEYEGVEITVSSLAEEAQNAFIEGIITLAWSPDSRTLAFAGQMNGDTSDVYLYDLDTRSITQLTAGLTQIAGIEWSPDGEWVVHSVYWLNRTGAGELAELFATKKDGSVTTYLNRSSNFDHFQWMDDAHFFTFAASNGWGTNNLEIVDIVSGEKTTVWSDIYRNYAFDPANHLVLINLDRYYNYQFPDGNVYPALYLVDENNEMTLLVEEDCHPVFRGGNLHRFIAFCPGGIYGIDKDGNMEIVNVSGIPSISPDYQWSLIGTDLYNENDQRVATVTDCNPNVISWNPDSSGFFFTCGVRLFHTSIPNGAQTRIATNFPYTRHPGSDNRAYTTWIP